jgi:hypothetical protein
MKNYVEYIIEMNRRSFLKKAGAFGLACAIGGSLASCSKDELVDFSVELTGNWEILKVNNEFVTNGELTISETHLNFKYTPNGVEVFNDITYSKESTNYSVSDHILYLNGDVIDRMETYTIVDGSDGNVVYEGKPNEDLIIETYNESKLKIRLEYTRKFSVQGVINDSTTTTTYECVPK